MAQAGWNETGRMEQIPSYCAKSPTMAYCIEWSMSMVYAHHPEPDTQQHTKEKCFFFFNEISQV